MFSPYIIVMYESPNCPPYEKMCQNHTVTFGKGSNMQKMLEKLMNNYHKTERQSWIIQEMTHSFKIQGYVNF